MAPITSLHLPRSRSAGTAANLRSLFRGRKFLKGLTVGQAVPEIPLSEGSKSVLHRAFVFCQISVYFPVHSRICPRVYMYIVVYIYTCTMYIILAILHAEGFAL